MKRLIILSFFAFCTISCNSSIDGEGSATAEQEIAVDQILEGTAHVFGPPAAVRHFWGA